MTQKRNGQAISRYQTWDESRGHGTGVVSDRKYQIRDLTSARNALSLSPRHRFTVEIEGMSADEAEILGSQLSQYSQDCGCDLGARFLVLSIAVSVLVLIVWRPVFLIRPYLLIGMVLVSCFCVAGLGKALGIVMARHRLREALKSLCRRLDKAESASELVQRKG